MVSSFATTVAAVQLLMFSGICVLWVRHCIVVWHCTAGICLLPPIHISLRCLHLFNCTQQIFANIVTYRGLIYNQKVYNGNFYCFYSKIQLL